MIRLSVIVLTLASATDLSLASASASAQMHDHAHMHSQADAATAVEAAPLSSGEIKRVDKDTGKLTIQHGPLVNLNMPGMTMIFKVADPAMLDRVKEGDQVRFRAEQVNGVFTVTKLELAR